jgi:two-component system, LytTR family, sensor kinase
VAIVSPREDPSESRTIGDIFRRPGFWLICLFGLHFLILFNVVQDYFYAVFAGKPPQVLHYLTWSMLLWYSRVAIVPFAVWIALRYRLQFERWFRCIAIYAVGSACAALFVSALQGVLVERIDLETLYFPLVSIQSVHLTLFQTMFVRGWPKITYNMLTCWLLIALIEAMLYHDDAHRRRLEALQLEKHLVTAKLKALQMQLNPHFLFNTLHAISTLIEEEPRMAEEMILRLGHLLRGILDEESPEISLRRELCFLDDHLAIERVRFGDRLSTLFEIDDALLNCAVPQLLLQPLVENVIQHGIGKHSGRETIKIKVSQDSEWLRIELRNTNSHLEQSEDIFSRAGIGISNTMMRLNTLYRDRCSLNLTRLSPSGVAVSVAIPFRELSMTECQHEREILS